MKTGKRATQAGLSVEDIDLMRFRALADRVPRLRAQRCRALVIAPGARSHLQVPRVREVWDRRCGVRAGAARKPRAIARSLQRLAGLPAR
jgi:hypothetical protein